MLVCAPPEASRLRLFVQRWDTINLPVQFRNFQWLAAGDLPRNLSGNEYFSGQVDSVDPGGGVVYRTQARDILVNGKWNMLRPWSPANGTWHIGDKVRIVPSRKTGPDEIFRITDGNTNNFYTDWAPGPWLDFQQVVTLRRHNPAGYYRREYHLHKLQRPCGHYDQSTG